MTKEYLLKETERLARRNDELENKIKEGQPMNLSIEEQIQKNTLAMCEIAKVYINL